MCLLALTCYPQVMLRNILMFVEYLFSFSLLKWGCKLHPFNIFLWNNCHFRGTDHIQETTVIAITIMGMTVIIIIIIIYLIIIIHEPVKLLALWALYMKRSAKLLWKCDTLMMWELTIRSLLSLNVCNSSNKLMIKFVCFMQCGITYRNKKQYIWNRHNFWSIDVTFVNSVV